MATAHDQTAAERAWQKWAETNGWQDGSRTRDIKLGFIAGWTWREITAAEEEANDAKS